MKDLLTQADGTPAVFQVERVTRLFGKDYAWVRGKDTKLHLVPATPVVGRKP